MESERSAEDYLSEIESETLQQFLHSIRIHEGSMSSGIPTLDACLRSDTPGRRSALQFGDVIEIQGSPASGKTHLLYRILMNCLLPPHSGRTRIGGWGKSAVVFDTDGTFQVTRLKALLYAHLNSGDTVGEGSGLAGLDALDPTVDELISSCLSRLYLFRPTSTVQLAATILNLPNFHATDVRLEDQEIGLLAVDSMSSFYWQDRFMAEQLRSGPSSYTGKNPLQNVITALEQFRLSHHPVVFLTNWGLQPLSKPTSDPGKHISPFFRQHLHMFPRTFSPSVNDPSLPSDHHDNLQPSRLSSRDRMNAEPSHGLTRLSLTHHITLRSSLSVHLPGSDNHVQEEHTISKFDGFVRLPGHDKIGTFSFYVGVDGVRDADET
ncbi:hypothetical protein BDW22DRAFT_1424605 [Trametopsis cervina]|nr:hypothetical protein BDW22DRAFT_1424605 [Trametopsis cervina]